MSRVIADISVSVDGFVTGPDPGPAQGLGRGGEPIHDWVMDPDDVDAEVIRRSVDHSGAVVMGRRLFDVVAGPHGWTEEMGYGAAHATRPPFVVVTSTPPAEHRLTWLDVGFATDGLPDAVEQARAVAGDRDVVVMGGAQVVDGCVRAGLADELWLHVSPVLVGSGTRLFEDGPPVDLEIVSVRPSRNAIHVSYRVGGPSPTR